jgi:hypothetical protein
MDFESAMFLTVKMFLSLFAVVGLAVSCFTLYQLEFSRWSASYGLD